MNEKIDNKILGLCLLPIYSIIAFFTFFVVGLNDTYAENIPVGEFAFGFGGVDYVPWDYGIGGNQTFQFTVSIYNYEGMTRPYTYIVLELCVTWTGLFENAYVSNSGYSTDFINDGKGVTYNTEETCRTGSYNGIIVYKQLQIGKYYDADGTGEELAVSGYLNFTNPFNYYLPFTLKNIYLSDNDYLTSLSLQQNQILQAQNNTNNIINNQNQNQQQTNQRLDNVDNSINETKDYLEDDTPPESDISSLGNVDGLLPAGPLDSLLNIPAKFLSVIVSSFGSQCRPLSGDFIFGSTLTIPCFGESFYSNVPNGLMVFINLIPGVFILIVYFKYLYKKVERATSMDTSTDDMWGAI